MLHGQNARTCRKYFLLEVPSLQFGSNPYSRVRLPIQPCQIMINKLGLLSAKEARTRGSAHALSKTPPPPMMVRCGGKKERNLEKEKGWWRDYSRWNGPMTAAYIRS